MISAAVIGDHKVIRVLTEEDISAGAAACEIMRSMTWIDHAPTMHHDVIYQLKRIGFEGIPEFRIGGGRIDVVAYFEGGNVAIELDCRKPRAKSIRKLLLFDGFRIIGLRGVFGLNVEGIDEIVCLPVKQPTETHLSDRRIYRPSPIWAEDWRS